MFAVSTNRKEEPEAVFQARGLSKVYHMGEVDVHALRSVDVDLYQGELMVLLGASGSGKSTLLNILGGLDTPTSGEVHYRDHILTAADDRELTRFRRDHVGFVFQFYNLIPSLTALENVELVTDIALDPMEASEALRLVGLTERMNHFPSQLSGGEQQRVAIARAVAKRPEVLLCDEPTGALDYKTGKLVLEENERVVTAGAPLLELSNTVSLEVVADVLSTDAVKIKPGALVLIEGWGGDEPLRARVRLIEPSAFTKVSALGIEEQRVNVISDFVTPAPLGDGFRVEARFITWEGGDVLKVPSSAVFRSGDKWSVFLVISGKAHVRVVEVGQRTAAEVEIKRGLDEGDIVILHPSDQIAEGARVEHQQESP